jgi:hypothetical protein
MILKIDVPIFIPPDDNDDDDSSDGRENPKKQNKSYLLSMLNRLKCENTTVYI